MKKFICILSVLLISSAVSLFGKKISHLIVDKPENKTVRFSIYAGTDYSAPIYKNSEATVILTICSFNGNRQKIVWQQVIDKGSLQNYPVSSNPLNKEVFVNNIPNNKTTIAAYYEVVYDSRGSKMSYVQGISLSHGSQVDSLQIAI